MIADTDSADRRARRRRRTGPPPAPTDAARDALAGSGARPWRGCDPGVRQSAHDGRARAQHPELHRRAGRHARHRHSRHDRRLSSQPARPLAALGAAAAADAGDMARRQRSGLLAPMDRAARAELDSRRNRPLPHVHPRLRPAARRGFAMGACAAPVRSPRCRSRITGGLGAASLAAFLLQFFHPFDVTFMDLAVHAFAVTLVGLLCTSGRRLLTA